ncbi:MAG: class I SAM-dependent methyltransferase [Azospirillaceae bacterium]|nr:class I SAM-dependent methyltransferase [Azospirillaceae bacterium]
MADIETRSVPTTGEVNREGYDRWSGFYDRHLNSTVTVDERHFPGLWANLSPRRVLEIGCGTGRHTVKLARAGHTITAIDLSPGMMAQARQRLDRSDLAHRVTFVLADFMTDDALMAVSFDMVVMSLVLEHLADPTVALGRLAALLRPGGLFFLSEIHPDRIARGSRAHFPDPETGADVWLESHAHSAAAIAAAGASAGLEIVSEATVFGTSDLATLEPSWTRYRGQPMIAMWVFAKPAVV